MKKALALLLALALVLALAACGGGAPAEEEAPKATKEDLLSQATEVGMSDIVEASRSNMAKAKLDYCNKTLKIEGEVEKIEADHVVLGQGLGSDYKIDVYLPLEELVQIEKNQVIIVLGETTDQIIEDSHEGAGTTWTDHYYQMPTAFLAEDHIAGTGKLDSPNRSYAPAWNIKIGASSYLRLIYFAEGENPDAYKGQEINFTAKMFRKDAYTFEYRDAKIVK